MNPLWLSFVCITVIVGLDHPHLCIGYIEQIVVLNLIPMILPLVFHAHLIRHGAVRKTCYVCSYFERPILWVGSSYCAVTTVVLPLLHVEILCLSNVGEIFVMH